MDKSFPDKKIFHILKIQKKFKFICKSIDNYNNYYSSLLLILNDLVFHIKNKFNLNIIEQYNYNIELGKVDILIKSISNLPYELRFMDLREYNIINLVKDLDIIKGQIKEIILKNGYIEIKKVIEIFYDNIFDMEGLLFSIYNKIFIPTNLEIYNLGKSNDNSVVLYKNNKEEFIIGDIIEPVFSKLKNQNSFIKNILGAKFYLPIFTENSSNDNEEKVIIVFEGYMKNNNLELLYNINNLKNKKNEIIDYFINGEINQNFYLNYMKHISIRDFIVNNPREILEDCTYKYNKLKKVKNKVISNLVKDFLLSKLEEQRDILILLVMNEEDTESQYLAYLLYDLISNDTYLLKHQPKSEFIFNSLNWNTQKLFKNVIKKINKNINNILNFNLEDISYEKRIYLMRTDDYIKSKAIEKLKEYSKSGETSSKSLQYLEGILKIPFKIFKKETMFELLDLLKDDYRKLKVINKESIQDDIVLSDIEKLINKKQKFINLENLNIDNMKKEVIIKILNNIYKKYKIKKQRNIKERKKLLKEEFNKIVNKYKLKPNDYIKFLDYNIKIKSCDMVNKLNNNYKNFKVKTGEYLKYVDICLDNAVYHQEEAKNQIKRIIAQWINGDMKGYVYGFEGPPGTGKTSLAKKGIAKCLVDENGNTRPFSFIALGGSSNGSTLEGHNYTYVGSTWGRIVDILMQTKCMNPIIYIDELDKISNTENGREIIGILTHLTDDTQNDEFYDKYFSGVKLDLSKVLFIFSYNDYNLLDSILADRIHRVKFKKLDLNEKIHIVKNYIIPELIQTIGFSNTDIKIEDNVIEYIIKTYTCEAGVRKVRERIFEIIREINLKNLLNNKTLLPFNITIDFIETVMKERSKITVKKRNKVSKVGLVNGLYATGSGMGGITIIESFKTPGESKLNLELTGMQGDVMKESMKVAKTVTWNILPSEVKKNIKKEMEEEGNFNIHIHCPDGATPKDGPSAGGAITLSIISLLTNIPVKCNVAMTGEIDLNGCIRKIGGLDLKIGGAIDAEIDTVLYPEENEEDIKLYREQGKFLDFNLIPINNINQILDISLEKNDIVFKNNHS